MFEMNDSARKSEDTYSFQRQSVNVEAQEHTSSSKTDAVLNIHQHNYTLERRKHKKRKEGDDLLKSLEARFEASASSECDLKKVDLDNYSQYGAGDYEHVNNSDTKKVAVDDLPDFAWLTEDFKFAEITDTFSNGSPCIKLDLKVAEPELSQRTAQTMDACQITDQIDERTNIEEEIKQKYAEINALVRKLNQKRNRSKRRRNYQLRKYDKVDSVDTDKHIPSYVNICPIQRKKNTARSIREALLVKTAMKKAWKGVLGSCCGKGCWAQWKWVNLRGVISDYE